MKKIITFCFLLIATAGFAVELSVELDRDCYYPGEPIDVRIIAYNAGPSSVLLQFSSYPWAIATPDAPVDWPMYGSSITHDQPISPGTEWVWLLEENWNLAPGSHYVSGGLDEFDGYIDAVSAPFLVKNVVFPKTKVLIDFEFVQGTDRKCNLYTYESSGIHFSRVFELDYDPPFITNSDRLMTARRYNASQCGVCVTPDFPVYGVSADVYAEPGHQITLLAKNSEGEVIESVTSDPMVDSETSQSLELKTTKKIASLEWHSPLNSSIYLDNICLERRNLFMECNGQELTLSLAATPTSCLEVCTNLVSGIWTPIPTSLGASEFSIPLTHSTPQYFRVKAEE